MSTSIAGVIALNALFTLTGLCLLWPLRGWQSALDVLEHLGVALMLGLAAVCVTSTVVLSLGGSLSFWMIIVICAALAGPAVEIAFLMRRPLPRTLGNLRRPRLSDAPARGFFVLTVAILIAFYRVARVSSFVGYDGYAFWIPKAKAIYFFGGLDKQLFESLANPSYPLLVPSLQAIDFHFMGSADVPNLAFQSWLLLAGFVSASAAILKPLVRPWITWLFLALVTLIPQLYRLLLGQADWTLDFFFVLAALFLLRWIHSREWWLLTGYGVALAATLATKREGALLGVCLAGGALIATTRGWRRSWPPMLAISAVAFAVNIPWRLWWMSHHLYDVTPGGIGVLTSTTGRIWPSLKFVLHLLFGYDRWLLPLPIALAAALIGLTRKIGRETAVFYLSVTLLCVATFVWILWSTGIQLTDDNSVNPMPRVVASLVLLSAVFAAPLVESLLRRREPLHDTERGSPPI